MDSDDIANEFRFENQVKYLNDNKHVSICGTWAELFGGESYSFKPSERWDRLRVDSLFGCQFIHPTVMFKRQTVLEHSLFYDESLSATEDFDLWARWIEVSPMANVPKSLLLYRRHPSSATHRNKEIGEAIYLRTMAHLLRRGGFMVDDSEVMIHFKAFNAKEISLFEYELLKSTFERLILWNRSRKFYSDHYLEASIKDRLGQLKSHWNF
jgi:hypothetical protein